MTIQRDFYIFNPVEIQRRDNTLKIVPLLEDGTFDKAKYIPVETIGNLYVFGAMNLNTALINFLGKSGVALHFFDYYEHYTGSLMPKEYLLAGKVLMNQTKSFNSKKRRIVLAQKVIEAACYNMLKNIKYYKNRSKEDLEEYDVTISTMMYNISSSESIPELMGIEGNIRKLYYKAFDIIINDFQMQGRSKQPPSNEINALISFGNSLCYSACLSEIYHTQLNPTISFLHEPGYRRFSLALDISEIFKPILVDRLIFKLLNKNIITKSDFVKELNGVTLKEGARKKFVQSWDEKLNETLKHRKLNKHVSYRLLIRLELYKLLKDIMKIEEYKALKMWW